MAALCRQLVPQRVWSAAYIDWWVAGVRELGALGMWVAEEHGEVVGFAEAWQLFFTGDPQRGLVWGAVDEAHRGRGTGGRMYELALAHARAIGTTVLHSDAERGGDGARFLELRGWRCTREEWWSSVDPRTVDVRALDALEPGLRVVPWTDVDDYALWEVHSTAALDIPGDLPRRHEEFDTWRERLFTQPTFSREGSHALLLDGRVVATAALLVDLDDRVGEHALTATVRDERGRGYATLAKLGAIRWAAVNDLHALTTANDEANAPMLAVNERLGYRPVAVRGEYVLQL